MSGGEWPGAESLPPAPTTTWSYDATSWEVLVRLCAMSPDELQALLKASAVRLCAMTPDERRALLGGPCPLCHGLPVPNK